MQKVFGGLFGLALSSVCVGGVMAAEPVSVGNGTTVVRTANAQSNQITLDELRKQAKQGDLRAILRIGELLETGTLLPKDPAKACQIYKIAADEYGKLDRYAPGAALVAKAFRLAAKCFAEGPNVAGVWKQDVDAAVTHYLHAGVMLRDPAATFELARLFLSSDSLDKNPTIAIDMLESAARKHFPPAQALLGSIMWEGRMMKQEKARGLALMMIGRERTSPEYRPLVSLLHDEAMMAASKQDEQDARAWVEKYKAANNGDPSKNTIGTSSTLAGELTVPKPSRPPARELQDFMGEIESYRTIPTGAIVPPADARPQNK
jgi:uncharacterized protein